MSDTDPTTRRTSEYTLEFTPHMADVPGTVERTLAHRIERCPRTVTGSGTLDGRPYLRFRAPSDDEAARVAALLTICGPGPSQGKPSVASAELRTGMGMYRRTIPVS
jgi:hypothetical protein